MFAWRLRGGEWREVQLGRATVSLASVPCTPPARCQATRIQTLDR